MTFDEWFDAYPSNMPISEYDTAKAAWAEAVKQAIAIVETYRVSVGNSAAGEMAAEWTMENLRDIRDELREIVPNAGIHRAARKRLTRSAELNPVALKAQLYNRRT